ncbi:unnamed protein product [Somion occarium]|uniref:Uncharacterized protein n=1 Tax=Somion occarium TaxID=3059160 RepID=A0ABP1E0B4_9APHY
MLPLCHSDGCMLFVSSISATRGIEHPCVSYVFQAGCYATWTYACRRLDSPAICVRRNHLSTSSDAPAELSLSATSCSSGCQPPGLSPTSLDSAGIYPSYLPTPLPAFRHKRLPSLSLSGFYLNSTCPPQWMISVADRLRGTHTILRGRACQPHRSLTTRPLSRDLYLASAHAAQAVVPLASSSDPFFVILSYSFTIVSLYVVWMSDLSSYHYSHISL